jgi:hypothetical protein
VRWKTMSIAAALSTLLAGGVAVAQEGHQGQPSQQKQQGQPQPGQPQDQQQPPSQQPPAQQPPAPPSDGAVKEQPPSNVPPSGGGGMKVGKGVTLIQEQVKTAQQKLKDAGYDPGPIDGIVGPKTRAAIRGFQQAKGLPVTGKLDQKTASAMGLQGG